MSLDKIEKYLHEFKELPYSVSEHVVIGGGEGLSPYLFGNLNYIPGVLSKIDSVDGVPTIKTNAVWGNNTYIRNLILQDLAMTAHKTHKLVTLDISVDEFHNNISGVANVFADILSNEYFLLALRPTLVGFNTSASANALLALKNALKARHLITEQMENGDFAVYNERGMGMRVVCDYESEIFDLGRAKENNVFTCRFFAPGFIGRNCIQIDGNDMVVLNNYYRAKTENRSLKTVVNSLIHRGK